MSERLPSATVGSIGPRFLSDGGEMGSLLRSHDWSASPLGRPASWPQALRTVVRVMLNTRHPVFVFWGEDSLCLYNDAYRQSIGPERHPGAIGRPGREVWAEIWDVIGPQIEQVMAGGDATWHENQYLPITRNGRVEDVWWTYSYSPIDDEASPNGVGGILVLVTETTEALRNEKRLVESEERLRFALKAGRLGSWSLDLSTMELTTSALCRTNFGRPAEAPFSYADLRQAIHPDDRERMAAAVRSSVESRGNYDIEYRIVLPDGETRWIEVRGQPGYAPDGTPVRMDGVTLDVTARQTGEEHMRLMVNELNHRVKNSLAAVQAIAAQTFRDPDRFEASRADFSARLIALAKAHDLLTESNWAGATLHDVVVRVVEPHRGDDGRRFRLDGPPVSLDPKSALALSMAIHELCTNAAKYGALSTAEGRIDVVWTVTGSADAPRHLHLTWRETAGPAVEEPRRRGFGSRLVERGLAAELGGEARIAYEPSGVVCTIDAPLRAEPGGT